MADTRALLQAVLTGMKDTSPSGEPLTMGAPYTDQMFSDLSAFSKAVFSGVKDGTSRGREFPDMIRSLNPMQVARMCHRTTSVSVWNARAGEVANSLLATAEARNNSRALRMNLSTVASEITEKLGAAWKGAAGRRDETSAYVVAAMGRAISQMTESSDDKKDALSAVMGSLYPPTMSHDGRVRADQAICDAFVKQVFEASLAEKPFPTSGFDAIDFLDAAEKRSPGLSLKVDAAIAEVAAYQKSASAKRDDGSTVTQISDSSVIRSWSMPSKTGGTPKVGRDPFEGPAVQHENFREVTKSAYFWNGERLGTHIGPLPPSDEAMESILSSFKAADPAAYEACAAAFAERSAASGMEIADLSPVLQDIAREKAGTPAYA